MEGDGNADGESKDGVDVAGPKGRSGAVPSSEVEEVSKSEKAGIASADPPMVGNALGVVCASAAAAFGWLRPVGTRALDDDGEARDRRNGGGGMATRSRSSFRVLAVPLVVVIVVAGGP